MEIDDEALERLLITAYHSGWGEGWDQAEGSWTPSEDVATETKVDATSYALNAVRNLHNRVVSDGMGSEWMKCDRVDCGLGVTRPGSADCYGYFPCLLEERPDV
jgi:hypothetical protein